MSKLGAGLAVIDRRGVAALNVLDRLLQAIEAVVVPFDDHQAIIARDAFACYGKGRHAAGLNFGDCASYALAIAEAEPLLFKGTDFAATDVRVVEAGCARQDWSSIDPTIFGTLFERVLDPDKRAQDRRALHRPRKDHNDRRAGDPASAHRRVGGLQGGVDRYPVEESQQGRLAR